MRRRFLALSTSAAIVATSIVTLAAPAALAADHLVTVGDFFFAPANINIKAGDTVNFRFVGPEPHSATSTDGAFDTGIVNEGVKGVRFPDPGVYDYFCVIHPDMEGSVRVAGATAEKLESASNTIAQALQWSRRTPAGSAPIALLARSDVFADALASGGLQGRLDAPLLLTQSDALNSGVAAELERLGTKRVLILGGANAVSSRVADQLRAEGYGVDRVAGPSRMGTATAIAARYLPRADTAILARAFASGSDPTRAFADSIGAGAVAAVNGWPVLLSETDRLSPETEAYLTRSAISRVVIAGGTAAIGQAVEDRLTALGIEVSRAAGADRIETASLLALEIFFDHGAGGLYLIDTGGPESWASGLAAAHGAAREDAFVLPAGAVSSGLAWQYLIEDRPQVTCGSEVDATLCDRAATAATSTPFEDPGSRFAFLDGEYDDGNPEALGGAALLHRTADPGAVCWDGVVFVEATAAHVHRVSDGAPVIPLEIQFGPFGDPYSCSFGVDPAVVRDVFESPEKYYINIHSEAFPDGEIAGELFQPDYHLFAGATGAEEVPPVDQPGGAFVGVMGDDDRVCSFLFVENLSGDATAAHVHEGARGSNGPVVVALPTPITLEEGFALGIGCSDAAPADVVEIGADPAGHYVNIHTEANPNGEFRGQLVGSVTAEDTQTASRGEATSMRQAFGISR